MAALLPFQCPAHPLFLFLLDIAGSTGQNGIQHSSSPHPSNLLRLDSNLLFIPHSSKQLRPGALPLQYFLSPAPSPSLLPQGSPEPPNGASASTLTLQVHSSPGESFGNSAYVYPHAGTFHGSPLLTCHS